MLQVALGECFKSSVYQSAKECEEVEAFKRGTRSMQARTGELASADVRIPMRFDRRGSYVVDWMIDGNTFSGVVDTGSPFLTVSGKCGELDAAWGCLDAGFDSERRKSLRVLPPTYEIYGLQEDGLTDWLKGEVDLLEGQETGEEKTRKKVNLGEDIIYGASSGFGSREGSAPGNIAPMFGLVREVAKGIRPSFLSQTRFSSFTIDFDKSELSLSAGRNAATWAYPNTKGEMLPMVDLRPLGAPAFEYACKVERLVVNGYDVEPERPIFAIFDTGTTGMLVSSRLWEESLLQLGVAQCAIELATVDGQKLVVAASTRSCRRDCLLVATPIDVLWQPPTDEIGPEGPPQFDVIFVGLAFLTSRGYLTVDMDRNLLGLGAYRDLYASTP